VTRIETRAAPTERTPEVCRQVAETLGFRSVGVVSGSEAPVEAVLQGRVDGLIVFRLDDDGEGDEEDNDHAARSR
jgi:hypothetical protein